MLVSMLKEAEERNCKVEVVKYGDRVRVWVDQNF